MPIPVTKYTCVFRCGHKAVASKATMNHHESICWHNPKTKSCTTCVFEDYRKEYDDFSIPAISRGCKHPEVCDERFDELLEGSGYFTTPAIHVQPVRNCPFHKQKN